MLFPGLIIASVLYTGLLIEEPAVMSQFSVPSREEKNKLLKQEQHETDQNIEIHLKKNQ